MVAWRNLVLNEPRRLMMNLHKEGLSYMESRRAPSPLCGFGWDFPQ